MKWKSLNLLSQTFRVIWSEACKIVSSALYERVMGRQSTCRIIWFIKYWWTCLFDQAEFTDFPAFHVVSKINIIYITNRTLCCFVIVLLKKTFSFVEDLQK